ncbi:hypothetical protein NOVOSPHI9U_420222 [Novosphingobium sp. 9U]|nr:hypothetical protein NOVOSPHI9U_420222 [Novosphingobium sp. 9U]
MVNRILANNETLLRQASKTAEQYLQDAIGSIDHSLGQGYAEQHPELIAGFMTTAALDYGASVIARALGSLGDGLDD